MPMILVRCACGQTMQAPDTAVGKQVRCPTCRAAVPVAAPTAERLAAPPNGTTATSPAPKPMATKPTAATPAAAQSAAPAPAKRGNRRLLAILGCLGLVLLGCLSGVGIGGYYIYNGIVGVLTPIKGQAQVSHGATRADTAESVDAKLADSKSFDRKPADNQPKDAPNLPAGKGPRPGAPLTLKGSNYAHVVAVRMNAKGVLVTFANPDLKVWDPATWTVKKKKSPGQITALDVAADGTTMVFFTCKVVKGIAEDLKNLALELGKGRRADGHRDAQALAGPGGHHARWQVRRVGRMGWRQ